MIPTRFLMTFFAASALILIGCGDDEPAQCSDLDGSTQCADRPDCVETAEIAYSLDAYDEEYGDDDPEFARPCPSALEDDPRELCVDADWANAEPGDAESANYGRLVGGFWQIYRLDHSPEDPEKHGFVDCPEVFAELGESTAWEVCAYCAP